MARTFSCRLPIFHRGSPSETLYEYVHILFRSDGKKICQPAREQFLFPLPYETAPASLRIFATLVMSYLRAIFSGVSLLLFLTLLFGSKELQSFTVSKLDGLNAAVEQKNTQVADLNAQMTMWDSNKISLEYIKNNYYILLSRGMDGCRVYFTNKKLEAYFKSKMKA